MLPIIHIGRISVQTPGLVILLGMWVGLNLAEKKARFYDTNSNNLLNLITLIIITGLIGARLIFVFRNIDAFINSPLNLISINSGLLDPIGGIGTGFIAGVIYINRKEMEILPLLDALTPFFAVLTVTRSLTNIASGDAFGIETQLLIGIELWGAKRFPIQIFEFLMSSVILWIVLPRRENGIIHYGKPGSTFFFFTALYAFVLLLLETGRFFSDVNFLSLRFVQFIAWIIIALCLWVLIKLKK